MKKVAVVDYGIGNLDSVARAVEECGGYPLVTDQAHTLEQASYIILPGVGSFSVGITNLRKRGLDEILSEQVLIHKIPFLGICLGMQLLAKTGDEGGRLQGLGWIGGEVQRLEASHPGERIPHVGWNEVHHDNMSTLLTDIASGKDFYFVHSYHLIPYDKNQIVGHTPYCGGFASVVTHENIMGVQFHPEKSQRPGFQILRNFLSC